MNTADLETDRILAQIANQQLTPTQGLQQLKKVRLRLPAPAQTAWLCHAVWQPVALDAGKKQALSTGVLLLFTTNVAQKSAWQAQFPQHTVIVVTPDASQHHPQASIYALNPTQAEDYQTFIATLQTQNQFPTVIVHAWSQTTFSHDADALDQQLEQSFYSLFYLSKALMAQKLTQPVRLLYVHQQPEQGGQPLYAGLTALAKTLTLENPKLQCQTLAVAPESDVINLVYNELQYPIHATEVAYRAAQRFEKSVQPLSESKAKPPLVLKQHGVYLITGGAGGLGLLFAQYLAQHYQAKLILTGRSALKDAQTSTINLLNKLGAEAVYLQADVSKQTDVFDLIAQVKNQFGQLHGIIHSAGVIKDALVSNKTVADAAAVLAPKVHGSVWLDAATQNEPLDFFVLFSSLAGVIGNAGQCDYAFANCFMDNFTAWREQLRATQQRTGQTYAMNWPFWQHGGMHMNAQAEQWLQKHKGLYAMPTTVGVQAFKQILAQSQPAVAVFYGDQAKMQTAFQIQASASSAPSVTTPAVSASAPASSSTTTAASADLQAQVEQELLTLASELLKVAQADLDLDTDFAEYGVDSIMMMNMLNRLEALYGQTVSPNAIVDYPTIRDMAGYLIAENIVQVKVDTPPTATVVETVQHQPVRVTPLTVKKSTTAKTRFMPTITAPTQANRKIAVIGMACRLPGADTPQAFWDNLVAGRHLVGEIPAQRWSIADYYSPVKPTPSKTYSKWAAYIDEVEYFDAAYFGINDLDALTMDPQHRVLLTLNQILLDNSGYRKADLSKQRVGVFIGGSENYFVKKHLHQVPPESRNMIVNTIQNMMAARLSDYYDFKGPALTLDTACSSSLVAIHQACQSLLAGESDYAIAGGIELLLDPFPHIAFSQAEVLSDDDKCYVFDARAKGLVLGEGAGLVMLKPYEQAVAAGDAIVAVIDGSAVNNDGHTMGVTVPNLEGQKAVIQQALEVSKVNPAAIGYVEAHGTGTLLGDPIEIKALSEIYRQYTPNQQYCAIGSVKSNIGHLGHAAGIASFIKVLLTLQNRVIPPTLHCDNPHPRFKFNQSPFYPITQHQTWTPYNGAPLTAALSSFGFGGTNCHVIVEAFVPPTDYVQQRQALPPTAFQPKRYWLSDPVSTSATIPKVQTAHEMQLSILTQLSQGKLTPEQAMQLRQLVLE